MTTNVVFTCIIGPYDVLCDVQHQTGIKFICFTTEEDIKAKGWEIIKLSKEVNPIKQARKIKILSKFKCEYSLWIDGNISPIGDVSAFIEKYKSNSISLLKHPDRINIAQEVDAIIRYKKDNAIIVKTQLQDYKTQGYLCNELAATGILLRKNTVEVDEQAKIWFGEILKHSHRDQMSFNYACWKKNIVPTYIPYQEINGSTFKYNLHPHRIKEK